jgi:hypothetical protein
MTSAFIPQLESRPIYWRTEVDFPVLMYRLEFYSDLRLLKHNPYSLLFAQCKGRLAIAVHTGQPSDVENDVKLVSAESRAHTL